MESRYAVCGRVVLEDRIVEDGAVVIDDGQIVYAGERSAVTLPETVKETGGKLIGPGFIDIHCHAGDGVFVHEDPETASAYHLRHGTTGMLCTLYRSIPHKEMLAGIEKIRESQKTCRNILGIHLEGPYLNPKYGTGAKTAVEQLPDPKEYQELIDTGMIRYWTYAPELEGADQFLMDLNAAGIPAAMGHSEALPDVVFKAAKNGARAITHLFDATGSGITPTRVAGTKEMTFDMAALLCDDLYYEIICDRKGYHVRPELLRLAIKTVGIDKIVGITDCFTGGEQVIDVCFIGDELSGSKLTMQMAAQNLKLMGLNACEIFRILSLNPARAIYADGEMGSLRKGKKANIVITDDNFEGIEVILS